MGILDDAAAATCFADRAPRRLTPIYILHDDTDDDDDLPHSKLRGAGTNCATTTAFPSKPAPRTHTPAAFLHPILKLPRRGRLFFHELKKCRSPSLLGSIDPKPKGRGFRDDGATDPQAKPVLDDR